MKKEAFLTVVRNSTKKELSEPEIAMFGAIGEAVESAFQTDAIERNAQIKVITDKLGMTDEGQTIAEIMRNVASKVDELEKKASRSFSPEQKDGLRSKLEAKKDEIERARKGGAPWEIQFSAKRAASAMMTTASIMAGAVAINNTNSMDDLEVLVIQYPKNFILDAIDSRKIAKVPENLRWKYQIAGGDGVATKVLEGAVKPLIDKKFAFEYAYREKYAGRIEFTEEVEIDFDQLVMQIITMFEDDVIRVWQDAVLAKILAYADVYTTTALDGKFVKPSVYSVIGAAKLHVQNSNYDPDVVLMNPGDAAEAIYLQDNDGNQQFIPESLQFGGLMPIISTKIPLGQIVVGTKRTIKELHSSFIIRKGVYGDQFIENESTIIGEIFSILKLPTITKPSWIKIDVATVKEALQVIVA